MEDIIGIAALYKFSMVLTSIVYINKSERKSGKEN